MPSITLLSESDLRALVPLDLKAIDCIESAFVALASGEVLMPPILSMALPDRNAEVDVKTAYMPGIDSFAIKMAPGFFDNPSVGLPTTSGLMVLFSVETGAVQAVLLDNGYLTEVRTAAAGAVAARHLARVDAQRAGIVGAGAQARLQLKALCQVRKIKGASIWARDGPKAEKAARELSAELGFEVTAASELRETVVQADVVISTTPATFPLIKSEWLQPGQHITAMGSDQDHKVELDPNCLVRAYLYVPDRLSQTRILGELRYAIKENLIEEDAVFPELGDIVAKKVAGRKAAQDITIADLTGTGAQDTAIATYAHQRALTQGTGAVFES